MVSEIRAIAQQKIDENSDVTINGLLDGGDTGIFNSLAMLLRNLIDLDQDIANSLVCGVYLNGVHTGI